MIEKLGHTKRIQTMRREWIEEEKPRLFTDPEPALDTRELPTRLSTDQSGPGNAEHQGSSGSPLQQSPSKDADQELFIPDPEGDTRQPTSHPEPDDDDLEDLLREQDNEILEAQAQHTTGPQENSPDEFDADYEAMNELGL